MCILAKCRISVLAILLLLVLHYSQTGCSLAGLTVKPDVLLRATLQYCDAMLQYWLASCLEQIAIALTSCRSTVTVVFNVYCKIKGKFVPQACNMCIFKHFKLILNVFSPVRRLERELCLQLHVKFVWNTLKKLTYINFQLLLFPTWTL